MQIKPSSLNRVNGFVIDGEFYENENDAMQAAIEYNFKCFYEERKLSVSGKPLDYENFSKWLIANASEVEQYVQGFVHRKRG